MNAEIIALLSTHHLSLTTLLYAILTRSIHRLDIYPYPYLARHRLTICVEFCRALNQ